ncbi:MAG: NTP/NDP exchange transporter [Parachlamydiales bacterium]|nr:NTP/NDP exchange transporter [Parachlamydiales bacterium]
MEKSFGKIRSFFWPIKRFELKKVLPMFFLFFFFQFNYMILKDIKEPLIVTANGSGAEAIPFLKLWGVLPLALVFMFVYSKLSNKLSKKGLFYSIVGFFISFYFLFAFILYPLRDILHPNELADKLQNYLPSGFSGLIAIFRNWTYALFYSMAELWGSVGISLLFWGFSNDITKISESKRFYTLFGLGSSFAMLVAGPTIIKFSSIRKALASNVDAWGATLKYLMSTIFVSGLIIMAIYWWINKYLLTDQKFYTPNEQINLKKEKIKMPLSQAIKFLFKSRYLLLLAGIVMGYSISISFVEIVWKSQLKIQFPNPNDYSTFRGYYSTIISILSLIMLFIGGGVVRKFGWKKAALATPIILFITGLGFFGFLCFKTQLADVLSHFKSTPLIIAIAFGTVQNATAKAFKSSFFEPTKEMAYIPLDSISKTQGKAAIDVLVAKFSKAGGSLLLQGLIIIFGSIIAIIPFIGIILLGVLTIWIISISKLNKRLNPKEGLSDNMNLLMEEKILIKAQKAYKK